MAVLTLALVTNNVSAAVQVINLNGHMAWRVATGTLDATGAPAIVVGSYDGHIMRVTTTGANKIVWDYATPSGAAITDLDVGDFGSDGVQEIVAASADGSVYALSASGALLWKTDLQNGLALQAKVAHVDGPVAPARVAVTTSGKTLTLLSATGTTVGSTHIDLYPRYVRVGNFTGNNKDSLFVMSSNGNPGSNALALYDGALAQISNLPLDIRPPFSGVDYGFDLAVAAGTGTARDALVTPFGTALYATDLSAGPIWDIHFQTNATNFPNKYISYTYRSERIAVGNLTADPGLETASIEGPDLALYAANGNLIGSVQVGNPTNVMVNSLNPGPIQPRGFTDAAYLSGNVTGKVVFGSSPNGDDNIYIVTFDANWKNELKNLPSPFGSGIDATVLANVNAVTEATKTWNGVPATGQAGPYNYVVYSGNTTLGSALVRANSAIEKIDEYILKYPPATYPRLQFAAEIVATELGADSSYADGPWPQDQRYDYNLTAEGDIKTFAQRMQSQGAKFWLWTGHGTQPYISLATAEKVIKTWAPTACLGFIQSENEGIANQKVISYVQNVLKPQLDLAKQYNKQVIMREKAAYWAALTAIPQIGNVLFGGDYPSVILPSVEESNTRTPDINLAARVGAWLGGYVEGWNSHMSPDWFRWDVSDSSAYPLSGHASLRYFVTETALGSSSFSNLLGIGVPRIDEGLDPFIRLLGKGIIVPPTRAQVKGVSPIVLRMRRTQTVNPLSRFAGSADNGHGMDDYSTAKDGPNTAWAFGQQDCHWGLATTKPTDASTYLWNRKNQFDNHIPPTPYGFVAVLPGTTSPNNFTWSSTNWESDGDQLYRNGAGFGANAAGQLAAKTAMLADLQAEKANLPVNISGDEVFLQIVQQGANKYILYLVDPGFLSPQNRVVQLSFNGVWSGRDRLALSAPTTVSPNLTVTVPAGSLKIFDLTQISPGAATGGGTGTGGGSGTGGGDAVGGGIGTGGGDPTGGGTGTGGGEHTGGGTGMGGGNTIGDGPATGGSSGQGGAAGGGTAETGEPLSVKGAGCASIPTPFSWFIGLVGFLWGTRRRSVRT